VAEAEPEDGHPCDHDAAEFCGIDFGGDVDPSGEKGGGQCGMAGGGGGGERFTDPPRGEEEQDDRDQDEASGDFRGAAETRQNEGGSEAGRGEEGLQEEVT